MLISNVVTEEKLKEYSQCCLAVMHVAAPTFVLGNTCKNATKVGMGGRHKAKEFGFIPLVFVTD